MELRHLRYFSAVAEEQNVTRAAMRLHVSQPSLSRQIRDLEDELGLALFERSGKAIHLTELGRTFLKETNVILQRVDRAIAGIQNMAAQQSGEMNLGYAPSPTVKILPLTLKAFKKEAPRVRLTLHDLSSPEMLEGLRNGELQAALMMQPSRQTSHGVRFEKLRSFPITVAVSPTHPWRLKKHVSLAEILTQPLVAYSRTIYPDYHEMLIRIFGSLVKKLRFVEECDSGTSLIAAVETDRGMAVTSSSLGDIAGKRLVFIPLRPAPVLANVGLAYRRDNQSPLLQKLIKAAQSAEE